MWEFPGYEIEKPIDWDGMTARFGWFADMKGVPQDAQWHAEGDVYTHTKMVVESLTALPEFKVLDAQSKHILVASAMLHDVEKRSTTGHEIIDGIERIVSPGHARKGEFTARVVLYKDIPTPTHIREQIAKLVRLHGLPLWVLEKEAPGKEVMYASQVVNNKHLSMLARADVLGRICVDQEEILYRIDLFDELCREHHCWEQPRVFESNYGRYLFFTREGIAPDYVPFDDLRFDVHMICALPGTGKDTYIQQQLKELPVLSLDEIRRSLGIDPTDKKGNGRVIQMGKERAKELMRSKTSFVFNATNITPDMRSKWIGLFTEYQARVCITYLEVPYKTLLKQNHQRAYKVPVSAIDKMILKWEVPTVREAHEVAYILK
mgnify:CR=1 FL=1